MFYTTLTADMGAGDLIASVADNTNAPTTYPWRAFIGSDGDADQECIYVTGGVAEGLDWDVSRAKEGSDAHPHPTGAAIRFKPTGDGTTIRADDLTFDRAVVRTTYAGEVTAQANDAFGVMASKLFLDPTGPVTLEGAAGAGSFTIAAAGAISFSALAATIAMAADGTVSISGNSALVIDDGASVGDTGSVLTAQGGVGGNALWQQLVTVQTGAPGGTYVTPFIFDDTATTGGLYWWNAAAYVLIGLATT